MAVQWLSSGPITTPDGESAPVPAPPSGAAAVPLHAAPARAATRRAMMCLAMGFSFSPYGSGVPRLRRCVKFSQRAPPASPHEVRRSLSRLELRRVLFELE